MNDKYFVPENCPYIIGSFGSKKRIKKTKLEWILFDSPKKLLISLDICCDLTKISILLDSISLMSYNKKSPLFVDLQYILDNKTENDKFCKNFERLREEIYTSRLINEKFPAEVYEIFYGNKYSKNLLQ